MSRSKSIDDIVGIQSLGTGLEIRGDAVSQHRLANSLNVTRIDTESAIHRGQCFAAVDQILSGTRTSPPVDQFADIFRGRFVSGPRRTDQLRRVANDITD